MTTIDQVKSQAQDQTAALAGKAKGVVIGEIDKRSTDLGETLHSHASNLREVAQTLRERNQERSAQLAENVAARMDRLSEYLQNSDGERLVGDLENLARSQPLLTMAAGLILGFAAARILKASATQRYYADGDYTEEIGDTQTGMSYYED